MRFDGGLCFVITEAFADWLREHMVLRAEPIEHVVFDFEAVNFIDSQGAGELARMQNVADDRGVSIDIARMQESVREMLEADGFFERLGDDRVHASNDDAVNAVLARSG